MARKKALCLMLERYQSTVLKITVWSKTVCEYMLGQILIIKLLILPVL